MIRCHIFSTYIDVKRKWHSCSDATFSFYFYFSFIAPRFYKLQLYVCNTCLICVYDNLVNSLRL